ncbi:MAG TPA: hypothetical protein VGX71_25395 [Pseudaminobacter sp.]|nr:hypothetical protein [Pseudaminobacter sp.]
MSLPKAWFSLEPHQRFKELLDAAALQIQEREEASRAGTPEEPEFDEEGGIEPAGPQVFAVNG